MIPMMVCFDWGEALVPEQAWVGLKDTKLVTWYSSWEQVCLAIKWGRIDYAAHPYELVSDSGV